MLPNAKKTSAIPAAVHICMSHMGYQLEKDHGILEEPLQLTVVLESFPGFSSSSLPETHGSNWKMAPVSCSAQWA